MTTSVLDSNMPTHALNVPPRNEQFTGRESFLAEVKSALFLSTSSSSSSSSPTLTTTTSTSTSLTPPASKRPVCIIHSTGGMGKSLTAVEYTYRHRNRYSNIYWVRAQTETVLANSFMQIVHGLDTLIGLDTTKRIEEVKGHLRDTSNWLLVFDNVETPDAIKNTYWPDGHSGSILITTQRRRLDGIAGTYLALPPMSPEEGGDLILKNVETNELEEARDISHVLGGLPLALTQFAGYANESNLYLDQILDQLTQYKPSAAPLPNIWSQAPKNTALTRQSGYDQTLDTVWTLSFDTLPDDSKRLLQIMAFLEPDSIPEPLFIGSSTGTYPMSNYWPHWKRERFEEAVTILWDRNLIERHDGKLQIHRSLQKIILSRLDNHETELRNHIFDNVVAIVRQAYPKPNIVKRGDTANLKYYLDYIPHIIALKNVFLQASPGIPNSLIFADLLKDAVEFLWYWHLSEEAIQLYNTGAQICEALYNISPHTVGPIFAFLESVKAIYQQIGDKALRKSCIVHAEHALQLYRDYMDWKTPKNLIQEDWVAFGRFHIDCAFSALNDNDFSKCKEYLQQGLDIFRDHVTEEEMGSRYGMAYCLQSLTMAVDGTDEEDYETALALGQYGLDLIIKTMGDKSYLTVMARLLHAFILYRTSRIEKALEVHLAILGEREEIYPAGHSNILSSKYLVAVCYQNLGKVATAKELLNDILSYTTKTRTWQDEDIDRAQYRLEKIQLSEKHTSSPPDRDPYDSRHHEATNSDADSHTESNEYVVQSDEVNGNICDLTKECEEASRLLQDEEARTKPNRDMTFKEAMMLEYDCDVSFWHGRTTGKWSSGKADQW